MTWQTLTSQIWRRIDGDGYRIVDPKLFDLKSLVSSWQDQALPQKQWAVVEQEIGLIRRTHRLPPAASTLIELIRLVNVREPSILEIGCSSGYFSELFKLAGLNVQYSGCDYSKAFIDFANTKFPGHQFQVCDATKLPYRNDQFEIVVSGCCILHILDYPRAITESVRVANQFVIFHKTPIIHLRPTIFTLKKAYGVSMFEIQFNEGELIDLMVKNSLIPVAVRSFASMTITGLDEPIIYKDFLCRKK